MDAHLVFNGAAAHAVGRAGAAVLANLELGHHEQRDAAASFRGVGKAGQHQVHDVVGEVVLAGGDEDLGAIDAVAAVVLRRGAGLEQAQVGAAVGLGQAHGAGPAPVHQRLEEHLALPVVAMVQQRLHRAVGQQREVAPREVGGVDHFLHRHADGVRQALATVFNRCIQRWPAGFDVLPVGLAEPGRGSDRAGGLVETAAHLIAHAVERSQHGLVEARAFLEHRVDEVAPHFVLAQVLEQRFNAKDIVQGKADIGQGGLVAGHGHSIGKGEEWMPGGAQRSTPGRPGIGLSVPSRVTA